MLYRVHTYAPSISYEEEAFIGYSLSVDAFSALLSVRVTRVSDLRNFRFKSGWPPRVPDLLDERERGAVCLALFKLIFSVGCEGGPKDNVREVSSSLGNLYIIDNMILMQRIKHLHLLKYPIFKSAQNNQGDDLIAK